MGSRHQGWHHEQRKWGVWYQQPRFVLGGLVSATSYCAIYSISLWSLFPVSPQQDKTSWTLLPVRCGHMIWSMVGGWGQCVVERERFTEAPSAGRQQWFRTGWCHFDREQRGHVGVSGEPDTPTRPAPPPSLSATISPSVPHSLLLSQSCLVHLSHYNTNTPKIYNLSNHVLLWLTVF